MLIAEVGSIVICLIMEISYVFDGQPPDLKKQELAKRYQRP